MSVEFVTVPAWCRATRAHPISLILVHATRGGPTTTMAGQYGSTVNWFKQGGGGSAAQGWGASADVLIGAGGEVAEFVGPDRVGYRNTRANWSAGFGAAGPSVEYGADEHALSIELAQPTNTTAYTEPCIAAFIAYVRPLLAEFNIPVVQMASWAQLTSAAVPRGLIGHEHTAHGKRTGKTDPGPMFPWLRVLAELAAPAPAPPASGLDLTVPGTRIDREMGTSRYLGYNRALGREEHEIMVREYVYRPAP